MACEDPTRLPYQKTKTYEELIEDILLQIVEHQEDLSVEQVGNAEDLRFTIKANKEDRGSIIGRRGSTIGALHKLLSTMNRGKLVHIDLVD